MSSTAITACEEVVLPADGHGSDGVLDGGRKADRRSGSGHHARTQLAHADLCGQ